MPRLAVSAAKLTDLVNSLVLKHDFRSPQQTPTKREKKKKKKREEKNNEIKPKKIHPTKFCF